MRLNRIFGDIPTCRAHLPLNLGLSINETYQYQKKNNFNVLWRKWMWKGSFIENLIAFTDFTNSNSLSISIQQFENCPVRRKLQSGIKG